MSTADTLLEARNIVVATGLFQKPKIPAYAQAISPHIIQMHSGQYRNPRSLPEGAVLVVGSGQSGCQIVQELYQSGRKVYLCLGSAGRAPRRYRGKDVYEWLDLCGFLDRTVDKLPEPKDQVRRQPTRLRQGWRDDAQFAPVARDGVVLLGRLQDGRDSKVWLASDLKENLAKADKFEADIVKMVDDYIRQSGLDVPAESLPVLAGWL